AGAAPSAAATAWGSAAGAASCTAAGAASPAMMNRMVSKRVMILSPSGVCQLGAANTPQGCWPTGKDLTTFSAATSTTETSLELQVVVNRYFSSGVKAICETRWPTNR